LGIAHLLGATACVALYLGLAQTARLVEAAVADRGEASVVWEASSVLGGLGAGIALSGLLLWFVRRLRGKPFPRHPGEYMLVVEAISCLLGLGLHFLFVYLRVWSEDDWSAIPMYFWWDKILIVFYLIHAVIWTVAGTRIAVRRWRRLFFLCAASNVLDGFLNCAGIASFVPVHYLLYVLVSIVLVVIVIRDHRQGMRYPWSHWLAVGIRFWFALLSVGWFVLFTFLQHWLETGS
jgi:hypothetical protein